MTVSTFYPTAYESGTNAWSAGLGNIYADDTSFASVTASGKNTTYELRGTTFQSSGTSIANTIPVGSIINSVTITSNHYNAVSDSSGPFFWLIVYDGSTTIGTGTQDTSHTGAEEVYTYGSTAPTLTQLRSANFKVGAAFSRSDNTAHTHYCDYIKVVVDWTPANSANGTFKQQLPLISSSATNVVSPRSADGTSKVQLPVVTGAAKTIVTSGLIAEWHGSLAKNGTAPGNNSDPVSTWNDLTGNEPENMSLTGFDWGSNGYWTGSGTTADPYALVFDGTDTKGVTPDSAEFQHLVTTTDHPFTIDMWVYFPSAPTTTQNLLGAPTDMRAGFGIYCRSTTGNLGYFRNTGGANYNYGGDVQPGSGWHHVAVSYAGSGVNTAYIDGTGDSTTLLTASVATTPTTYEASLGYRSSGEYLTSGTRIAAARIYDRSLSSTEIAQNYNAGVLAHAPKQPVATGGLKTQLPVITSTATNVTPSGDRSGDGTFRNQLPLIAAEATNVPPAREANGGLKLQLPLLDADGVSPQPRSADGVFRVQTPLITATGTSPQPIGTGVFRVQTPLISGTASVSRRADGAFRVQTPLISSSATNVPPARSANGVFRVQTPLISSGATNSGVRLADGTLKLQLVVLSGAASNVPPARSANGGLKLQLPIVSGIGSNSDNRTADGVFRIQTPLLSATATNLPARTADGTAKLQLPILASTAQNVPPARSADGTLKIQLPILSGEGLMGESRTASGGLALQLVQISGEVSTFDAEEAGIVRPGGIAVAAITSGIMEYRGTSVKQTSMKKAEQSEASVIQTGVKKTDFS